VLRAQGVPLREAIVLAAPASTRGAHGHGHTLGLESLAIGLNIDFYELFASGNACRFFNRRRVGDFLASGAR
jgi:hypothetical protein